MSMKTYPWLRLLMVVAVVVLSGVSLAQIAGHDVLDTAQAANSADGPAEHAPEPLRQIQDCKVRIKGRAVDPATIPSSSEMNWNDELLGATAVTEAEPGDTITVWIVVGNTTVEDCGGPAEAISNINVTLRINDNEVDYSAYGSFMGLPAPSGGNIPYASLKFPYVVKGDSPDQLKFTLEVEAKDSSNNTIIDYDRQGGEEKPGRIVNVVGPGITQVSFVADPNPAEAGAPVNFRVRVQNSRSVPIENIEALSGSSALQACGTGLTRWYNVTQDTFIYNDFGSEHDLQPGEIAECSYMATVPLEPGGATWYQYGRLSAVEADGEGRTAELDVKSEDVDLSVPELDVNKTVLSITRNGEDVPLPGPAMPGDVIAYRIEVVNSGDLDVGKLTISDSLTGPILVDQAYELAAGDTLARETTYLVPPDSPNPLENRVNVTARTTGRDTLVTGESAAAVAVSLSQLQVQLSVYDAENGNKIVEATNGQTIWYKLVITNNGDTQILDVDYATMSVLLKTYGDKPALNIDLAATPESRQRTYWYSYTIDNTDPDYDDPLTSTIRLQATANGRVIYATTSANVDITNDFIQVSSSVSSQQTDAVLRGDKVTYKVEVLNRTIGTRMCGIVVDQWRRNPDTGQLSLMASGLTLDWTESGVAGELDGGEKAVGFVTYQVGGDERDPLEMRFHASGTTDCGSGGEPYDDWTSSVLNVSDVQINTQLTIDLPPGQDVVLVDTPTTFSFFATNASTVPLESIEASFCVPHQGDCPTGVVSLNRTEINPLDTSSGTFELTFTEDDDLVPTNGSFPVTVTLTGFDNEGLKVMIVTSVQVNLSTDDVLLEVTAPATAVLGDTIPVSFTLSNKMDEALVNVCVENILDGTIDCAQITEVAVGEQGTGSFNYTIDPDTLAGIDINSAILTIKLKATGERYTGGETVIANGSTEVQISPVLTVEKAASVDSVAVGGTVDYTVTVTNNSQSQTVTLNTIEDDAASDYGQPVSLSTPIVIDPGGQASIPYAITGVEATPNPLVNNVVLKGQTALGAAVQGGASASVEIKCPIQFVVNPYTPRMTDGTTWPILGKTVDWHFFAENITGETLTNLSMTLDDEAFNPGFTQMTPGQYVEVKNLQELIDIDDYSSTTTESYLEHQIAASFEGSTVNNCSQAFKLPLFSPVWVIKTADKVLAFAGEQVTYTIRVENIPESESSYSITLTDDMLGVNKFIGTLAPGESWEETFPAYTVKESDPEELVNTAIAEFPVGANSYMWTPGMWLVYTRTPLELKVTPSSNVVVPGTPLEFTYEVTNTSPYPISGIVLTDTLLGTEIGPFDLGPGEVWPSASLPPDQNPNPFIYAAPLNPPDPVKNTVIVDGASEAAPMQILIDGVYADLQPLEQSVSVKVQAPDVTIDKMVFESEPAKGTDFDNRLELPDDYPTGTGGDGIPEWNQVEPVDYCFEVSNNNTESPATYVDKIVIEDAKLDLLIGGDTTQDLFEQAVIDTYDHDDYPRRLYGGEMVRFCAYDIQLSRDLLGDPAVNIVTLNGETLRGETLLPIYDEDEVVIDILGSDLLITKEASVPAAYVGQTIEYTIRIENKLGGTIVLDKLTDMFAGGAQLTIPFDAPGWDWSAAGGVEGEITGGGVAFFVYPHPIMPTDPDPLINTATITGRVYDAAVDPSEWEVKTDSTRTAVAVSSSQLVVRKDSSTTVAKPGDKVTYYVTITNIGSEPVYEIELNDPAYEAKYGAPLTEKLSRTTVEPWNDSVSVSYTLTMPTVDQLNGPDGQDLDPFINTVTATGWLHNEVGEQTEKIESDATLAVDILQPGIRVSKTAQQLAATQGETVDYEITISNTSSGDDLTNLSATDLVTAQAIDLTTFTFVSTDAAKNGESYTPGDTSGAELDTLGPTESLTGIISVMVPDDWTASEFTNTVEATGLNGAVTVRDRSSDTIDIRDEGIEVVKRASPVSAPVGAPIVYSLRITNVGNVAINQLIISDPGIDATGTEDTITLKVTSETPNPFPGGDDPTKLEPDEELVYTYTYYLLPDDDDPHLNRASVMAYFDSGTAVITLADAWVDIQQAAIEVDKYACAGDYMASDDVEWGAAVSLPVDCADVLNITNGNVATFFLHVKNTGAVDLYNVAIHDILMSAGLFDSVVWPGGTADLTATDFAEGGTDELWIRYRYTLKAGDPDPLVNRVTVEGSTTDSYVVQDSDQASIALVSSDLQLTKEVLLGTDPITTASVGQNVTYRLTVRNLNADPVNNPITIVDIVDPLSDSGSNPICQIASLTDVPQTCEFTHVVAVSDGSPLVNTAMASGWQGGLQVSDSATHSLGVVQGGIEITKQASKPIAALGETITFNYTITNATSSVIKIENVVESDTTLNTALQASKPWKVDLLPGETTSFYASREMVASLNDPYTNTITVEVLLVRENVRRVAQATETVALVYGDSDLVVENTPNKAFVRDGETATFTYRVINIGEADVTNVAVTDNFDGTLGAVQPSGAATLKPGQSLTFYREVIAEAPGPILSTVRAEGDGDAIDTATAEVQVVTGEVVINKSADVVAARTGDTIHYTLQVTNFGTESLEVNSGDVQDSLIGVLVEPTFPPSLLQGKSLIWTGSYMVPASADVVNNSATVTAIGVNSRAPYEASDTVSIPVIDDGLPGNLVVTQSLSTSEAHPGEPVRFIFRVRNVGPDPVTNGTLNHDLLASPINLPTLLPGNEFVTELAFKDSEEVPVYGVAWDSFILPEIKNTAEVSIGAEVQDRATVTLHVLLLELDKSAPENARMGDTLAWTFTITSHTKGTVPDVALVDDLLDALPGVTWGTAMINTISPAGHVATASVDLPVDQDDPFYDQFEPNRIIENTATLLVKGNEQSTDTAAVQIVGYDVANVRVYQANPDPSGLELEDMLKTGNETFVEFTLQNLSTDTLTLDTPEYTVTVDGVPVTCALEDGVELPESLPAGQEDPLTVTCSYIPPVGASNNANLQPTLEVSAGGMAGGQAMTDSAAIVLNMIDLQLGVDLEINPSSSWAGEMVEYTVTVHNLGASPIGCDDTAADGAPCHLDIAAAGDDTPLNAMLVEFRATLANTVLESGGSLTSGPISRVIEDGTETTIHTVTVDGGFAGAPVGLEDHFTAHAEQSALLSILEPEIQVSISVSPNPPVIGQTVTYFITVTNTGQVPIDTLSVSYSFLYGVAANIDGITLTGGALRPNAQGTVPMEFVAPLNPGEQATGSVSMIESNTAPYSIQVNADGTGGASGSVVSGTANLRLAPQSAYALTPTPVPGTTISGGDPVLTKVATTEAAQPGGSLTWTVTIRNSGTGQMGSVMMQDVVPDTMTVNNAVTDRGTVQVEGQKVTASTGILGPGEAATITINTTVALTVESPGSLTNTACAMVEGGYAQFCEAGTVNVGPAVDTLPTTGIRVQDGGRRLDGAFGIALAGVLMLLMAAGPSNRRVMWAAIFIVVALIAIGGAVAVLISQGDDSGTALDTSGEDVSQSVGPDTTDNSAVVPSEAGGESPAANQPSQSGEGGADFVFELPEPIEPTPYVAPEPSGVRQIVIPKLAEQFDAPIPIVNVPIVNRQWDVSGLGYYVGWLEGTTWLDTDWGNTVLAAHVQLAKNTPGPFWGLSELTAGDEILLTEGDVTRRYIIQTVEKVDPDNWSVAAPTGQATLTLVTCTEWDNYYGVFSQRLVVRAVPETMADMG